MVWFFERGVEQIGVETRFDNGTREYVLIVRHPDTREETERFSDAASFETRLLAIERQLQAQQWRTSGPPVLLRAGWPIQRPPR